jgi:diguanylate cyclase (GGDEF)-like protein
MSLLALPFARTTLTASPTFLTISLALAASADGVTAYLFLSQARIGRSVPLMLLASGYFYSALAIVMHMLLFPGIFSPEGLLGAGAQSADWSWVWWHGGFPLFVIGYAIAHRRDLERVGDPRFSPPVVAVFAFVVVAIVASLGVLTLRGEHLLPAIVQRDRYDLLLSTGVGPLVMLSIVCALAALLRFTRLRTVTDLWLAVALFASLLDCSLTLFAGDRYSLGWYLARVESLFASTIVLLSFLGAIDRLLARLAILSRLDELTGLANRRAFAEDLASAIAMAARANQSVSLLMLDVDYFKAFNDTYGHQQGDEALRTVAACVAKSLTRRSDFAARYGGEEFAVVLPVTEIDGAVQVAERIRSTVVRREVEHAGSPLGVLTVSIGTATLEPAALRERGSAEKLVRLADAALYRAKEAGRNIVLTGEASGALLGARSTA